jgi:hypothetical protein
MSLGTVVYLLCLLTSAVCAFLLVRSYLRQREPLLLGTSLCFILLALNNLFVVMDILVLPDLDLRALRQAASLAAVCVLIYSFVWRSQP